MADLLIILALGIMAGLAILVIYAHRQQGQQAWQAPAIAAPRRRELPAPAEPQPWRPAFVLPSLEEGDPGVVSAEIAEDEEEPAAPGPCEGPDCPEQLPKPPEEPWRVRVESQTRLFCSEKCVNAWITADETERARSNRTDRAGSRSR